MQKKLADYFRLLIERRDELLTEFYETGALMLADEAIVIMGLLVGLNVIDCNLCVKVRECVECCNIYNRMRQWFKLYYCIIKVRRLLLGVMND